jgi:hypothetical protein
VLEKQIGCRIAMRKPMASSPRRYSRRSIYGSSNLLLVAFAQHAFKLLGKLCGHLLSLLRDHFLTKAAKCSAWRNFTRYCDGSRPSIVDRSQRHTVGAPEIADSPAYSLADGSKSHRLLLHTLSDLNPRLERGRHRTHALGEHHIKAICINDVRLLQARHAPRDTVELRKKFQTVAMFCATWKDCSYFKTESP